MRNVLSEKYVHLHSQCLVNSLGLSTASVQGGMQLISLWQFPRLTYAIGSSVLFGLSVSHLNKSLGWVQERLDFRNASSQLYFSSLLLVHPFLLHFTKPRILKINDFIMHWLCPTGSGAFYRFCALWHIVLTKSSETLYRILLSRDVTMTLVSLWSGSDLTGDGQDPIQHAQSDSCCHCCVILTCWYHHMSLFKERIIC